MIDLILGFFGLSGPKKVYRYQNPTVFQEDTPVPKRPSVDELRGYWGQAAEKEAAFYESEEGAVK